MQDWQTQLFLEAQAELVRVEGMKALNAQRLRLDESLAYGEDAFEEKALEIERLAREINMR